MPKKETKKSPARQAVLVTTEHRGVFFGYLVGKPAKERVKLERCRNCVYWDTSMRGFIGLATDGPGSGCRVGPPAPTATLFDITSVTEVSDKAAKRWEGAPWS